jgi:hypothetical protein
VAGAQELGVLGDQAQGCKTGRLPWLGGGGFVAAVPTFDAGDCGGGCANRNPKNMQFIAKKRSAC